MYFENLDCFSIVIRSKFLSVESDRNSKNSHHTKLLYGRSWTEKRRSCLAHVSALHLPWQLWKSEKYLLKATARLYKNVCLYWRQKFLHRRITPLEIHIRIFHENASFSKIPFSIVIHEFVDANLYKWQLESIVFSTIANFN